MPPTTSLAFLAARSGGDARTALNALELAREDTHDGADGRGRRGRAAAQGRALRPRGDKHYDFISAWIKSTRGSDVDASLYYLAVMLEGGEDARFIVRRMVILASEDIGMADPQALVQSRPRRPRPSSTSACRRRTTRSPSARSTSRWRRSPTPPGRALHAARAYVREHGAPDPPAALRSAAYPPRARLGRGVGYDNPHRHPGHVNTQDHLPESVGDAALLRARRRRDPALRERHERAPAGPRPRCVTSGTLRRMFTTH